MEDMRWTFQLLLEVFCTESDEYSSPIVDNTFIREEIALIDYPFEYSIVSSVTKIRFYAKGKFLESEQDGQHMLQFVTDTFPTEPLSYTLIEAIISRDKLIRA